MITTETAVVISALITSLTVCLVKVLHQTQNSKCKHIEMCCIKCDRDVPQNDVTNAAKVVTLENIEKSLPTV